MYDVNQGQATMTQADMVACPWLTSHININSKWFKGDWGDAQWVRVFAVQVQGRSADPQHLRE